MADGVERPVVIAIAEVGGRRRKQLAAVGALVDDLDETILVGIRQRANEDAVDDAEHRGGGADAERERDDGDGQEGRGPLKGPPPETHIARKVLETRGAELVARPLAHLLHAAEAQECLTSSLVRRHPGTTVLVGLALDVESNLVLESVLEFLPLQHRAESSPAFTQQAHRSPQLALVACRTSVIARDIRSHCASESCRYRRPLAVSA